MALWTGIKQWFRSWLNCTDCAGNGIEEIYIGRGEFKEFECEKCNGSGRRL